VRQCRGMIIVNSTTGLIGMGCGIPVIALGRPIYSLPGLTFQGDLDDFWDHGVPADPVLLDAFRRVVAARTQINGGFYGAGAIAMAVQGAAQRLEQHASQVRAVQPASYPREQEFGFPDDLRPIAQ
jgi:capsular polysaccharide export protein